MSNIRTITLLIATLVAAALAGCATGSDDRSGADGEPAPQGTLQQAGSSTVFPIAEAWAEELAPRGLQVVVAGGGSGAGASRLCAKEIDIGDMSRPMKESEKQACQANGVEPVEWKVAYDGLTVVVPTSNTFVDHLTIEELEHIWRPTDPAQTWADVRAGWPAEKIILYGPDSDSGTYEYFNEEVLGKKCGADGKQQCAPRSDYTPSADDNVLVEGVTRSPYAIGHFGFAYYLESQDRLKAVPIKEEAGSSAVAPTFDTIADGSYSPLGRPIYMYTNGVPTEGTPLHYYLRYAFTEGQDWVQDVGYVGLDEATLEAQLAKL